MIPVPHVAFNVAGLPGPQGSKMRHSLRESSAKVRPWRECIGYACNLTWKNRPPLDGPLHVGLTFWMPRSGDARRWTRWKANGADLDKLTRATLDGLHLNGTPLFADDRQIASLYAVKHPVARPGDPTGCQILIVPLGPLEAEGKGFTIDPVVEVLPLPTNPFLRGHPSP